MWPSDTAVSSEEENSEIWKNKTGWDLLQEQPLFIIQVVSIDLFWILFIPF